MRVLNIIEDTIVDGTGFRTSIYLAGCNHDCFGCHNPESHDPNGGKEMSVEEVLAIVNKNEFANVTFSGGDPIMQAEELCVLARRIKETSGKNIWCYTGFKFEHLMKDECTKELLKYIDVLVDGEYVDKLRDIDLLFRGSSNQRIIDVKKSIENNRVIEISERELLKL